MRWQTKLTAKEWTHVREWMTALGRAPTLKAIHRTRLAQAKIAVKYYSGREPCHDCARIAEKLGMGGYIEAVIYLRARNPEELRKGAERMKNRRLLPLPPEGQEYRNDPEGNIYLARIE